MRKLFMISCEFLPVRTGGTIRCEKLAKYLPQFGWETVVFTKRPDIEDKLDLDYKLAHCKIYAVKRYDLVKILSRLKSSLSHIFSKKTVKPPQDSTIGKVTVGNKERLLSEYIFVPDKDVVWAVFSFWKLWKIYRQEKPDLIFSSSPSHSVHLLGLFLKIMTKCKWVIEFRDPWTFNPFSKPFPIKIMDRLNHFLERKTLEKCDCVIVTSEEYKREFLKIYPHLKEDKIHYNPNGYDAEDFQNIKKCGSEKYVIAHIGNFYSSRQSVYFIQAIEKLLNEYPDLTTKIEVRLIGKLDVPGQKLVEESLFREVFVLTGFLPHEESIEAMCNANLLVLIPGPGNGTMPGKTFEYLAAKRPILCLANEGPAMKLIEKCKAGIVAPPENITAIKDSIYFLYNQKEYLKDNASSDIIDFYSRKNIAYRSATYFNTLVDQH